MLYCCLDDEIKMRIKDVQTEGGVRVESYVDKSGQGGQEKVKRLEFKKLSLNLCLLGNL